MCNRRNYIYLSILLLLISEVAICQTKSDSLWNVWTNTNLEDTTRLEALLKQSKEIVKSNTDSAFALANIGLQYAEEKNLLKYQSENLIIRGKTQYRKGKYEEAEITFKKSLNIAREVADSLLVSRSIHGIGSTYYARGDYETTLNYYNKSFAIASTLNDKILMAGALNNIGIINIFQKNYEEAEKNLTRCHQLYTEAGSPKSAPLTNLAVIKSRQGDLSASVELQFKALKINEEAGNEYSMAYTYLSISNSYFQLKDYDNYIKYTDKSYQIRKRLGDKAGILKCLTNFGIAYDYKKEYDKALQYFEEALAIARELNRKHNIGTLLNSIALIHIRNDQLEGVYNSLNDALAINKTLDDKKGIAKSYRYLGLYYKQKGSYDKAIFYLKKALARAEGLEIEQTQNISKDLYDIYVILGNSKQALVSYEHFVTARDSILNLESQQVVLHQQYQYENEKRALSDSLNYASQKLIQQEKLVQSKNQRTALIIILGLVTLFTIFAINRVRLT
ncbi:tetratricopeptide repeat protein, partial [Flammeovirga pacifica]